MSVKDDFEDQNFIKDLALDFFSCALNNKDDIKTLSWDEQKLLLDLTISNPLVKKYPGKKEYYKRYLKHVISCLESVSVEVHDEIYRSFCTLMQSKESSEADFHYRHYVINRDLNNLIVIKETPNLILQGTTGLRTWEAALLLSDWLLTNNSIVQNKNVLELGSGVGLTGIVISKFCQSTCVRLTDCHPRILEIMCNNISINFPIGNRVKNKEKTEFYDDENRNFMTVQELNWDQCETLSFDTIPDVIIGADIVYDPSVFLSLCNIFDKVSEINKNLIIFIVSTIRNEDTHNSFQNMLCEKGYLVSKLVHDKPTHILWDLNKKYCILEISKIK